MSDTPNMDKVQAALIADIQKNGMLHTFEWMHGWFEKVAEAAVEDELANKLVSHADDPTARGLMAMDMMMPLATSVSNHSSSPSANLLRQGRLAALARIVNYDFGRAQSYGSQAHRRIAWEQWHADKATASPDSPAA